MTILLLTKYQPIYKVTVANQEIGYIKNKNAIKQCIQQYIYPEGKTVEYLIHENMPKYELVLSKNTNQVEEEQVLEKIKKVHLATYVNYAIHLDGENKVQVASIEEASKIVENIKKEYTKNIELDLGIEPIYTTNMEEQQPLTIEVAKLGLETEIDKKVELQGRTINGITLSKPIKGIITSRYGVMSRVRTVAHTGLDIAANTGTPIKACAKGTVVKSGTQGGYGNLVILSHGNGVQTYYGHCSVLCVKEGDIVNENTIIAKVGSTGNSTGPHLHLEIRINGNTLDPQDYLYK